jgi:N-acetyltransferase 10
MGLAIAGAVALGYSNIFVTAPTPENLRTLFEFVFKGLDALEYKEHLEYDIMESTNHAFGKAIVRVNVYRSHRQARAPPLWLLLCARFGDCTPTQSRIHVCTPACPRSPPDSPQPPSCKLSNLSQCSSRTALQTIQYIQPQDHAKLGQAELLVVDEAAAIPLPVVKQMLGPYLVFLCSTVNGYEGTGRSLSLKLIAQLRQASAKATASAAPESASGGGAVATGRTLREVNLEEPIRYGPGDAVEQWLSQLLCLDAADHAPRVPPTLPHPDDCELFYVERDALFSGHRVTELALQQMMSLYVASHYKNTPNDLLLLSDAPAHHLFVLTAPVPDKSKVRRAARAFL